MAVGAVSVWEEAKLRNVYIKDLHIITIMQININLEETCNSPQRIVTSKLNYLLKKIMLEKIILKKIINSPVGDWRLFDNDPRRSMPLVVAESLEVEGLS